MTLHNSPRLIIGDEEISQLLNAEEYRQKTTINLIPSENYASDAVREALSSLLTNKYAEGYPGKRYYAGCENVDRIEGIAIERAKQLFGVEHANVQPHSGSQANMAVYLACLQPGDTILGMSLQAGGHLTHGYKINSSGRFYNAIHYGVSRETEQIDYEDVRRLALEHRPKLIIAGGSAYSRTIDFVRFGEIAREVGALLLADIAHIAGLIVTGLHPSPVGIADFITTTTHKTLRGPRGGLILTSNLWREKIDKAIMPGSQGGPLMHVIAAKAIAFAEALDPAFKIYQQQVLDNNKTLARELAQLGFRIVAGGTDNHLLVIDLTNRGITGIVMEKALERAGITVNRNCIPFETQSPLVTSGIRIGSPAVTTRGMRTSDMTAIVKCIALVADKHNDTAYLDKMATIIKSIAQEFPLVASEAPHLHHHTTPSSITI